MIDNGKTTYLESAAEAAEKRKKATPFKWWAKRPIINGDKIDVTVICGYVKEELKTVSMDFTFDRSEIEAILPKEAQRNRFAIVAPLGKVARKCDKIERDLARDARREMRSAKVDPMIVLELQPIINAEEMRQLGRYKALLALYRQPICWLGGRY